MARKKAIEEKNTTVEKKTISELFKGYTLYTEKEYKDIWANATIVIDTNILLNLYRYSKESRKAIIDLLKTLKTRLWIPYQVAKEYFSNRDKVIKDSVKELESLRNQMTKSFGEIDRALKSKEKNYVEIANLEYMFSEFKEKIEKEFEKINASAIENDSTKEALKIEGEILSLIDNHIGKELPKKEYEKYIDEGLRRIKEQLPPGYKDSDKEERYNGKTINGDYIVFRSFMNYAKENNKNIIFITADTKDDWFKEIDGEKIGGRQELLHEFYQETKKMLLIYSFEGFANKYNEMNPTTKISDNVINEIYTVNTISNIKDTEWHLQDMNEKLAVIFAKYTSLKGDSEYDINIKNIKESRIFLKTLLRYRIDEVYKFSEELEQSDNLADKEFNAKKIRSKIRIIIESLPDDDTFIKDEALLKLQQLTRKLLFKSKNEFLFKTDTILSLFEDYYFNEIRS